MHFNQKCPQKKNPITCALVENCFPACLAAETVNLENIFANLIFFSRFQAERSQMNVYRVKVD